MSVSVSVSGPGPAAVLRQLVVSGRLGPDDERRIAELAVSTGRPVAEIADRLGILSEADWAAAVSVVSGLPLVGSEDIPATLPDHPRLRREFLAARSVVGLDGEGDVWRFAVADPFDVFTRRALEIATGGKVALAVATYRDIAAALARGVNVTDGLSHTPAVLDAAYLVELANDAPTVKLVDRILGAAVERGATDIHLEAYERATRLRYRIDGVLAEQPPVPPDLYAGVVSRLKILAGLDIAERRLPQDGRIRHRSHGRSIDLRIATAPAMHGETVSLRLLNPEGTVRAMRDLLMPDDVRGLFDKALSERHGLILVTGPTGSGKTTTLHAALASLNTEGRKIVSVENPVEVEVPGVVQVEANSDIGLDFARTLRAFLRHDPDVMMVGEIRDRETADVAVQAALTGHLVLSTLHTNDARGAVTRLEDMGIDRFLIDAVLRLSAAQRLVRVLCQACRQPSRPGEPGDRLRVEMGWKEPVYEAVGCPACSGTGFRGRRAIYEAIPGDALVRGAGARDFRRLSDHATALVAAGVTTMGEALRVVDLATPSEHGDGG